MHPEEAMRKKIPYKFYSKFRPIYRPVHHLIHRPRFQATFKPRWDALIEMRRQQRHAYTPVELEKLRPDLVERWRQRHKRYAEETKAYDEALRAKVSKPVPCRLLRRYRPTYRPTYRPIYKQRLILKCKYRCSECGRGFLWLNDFLNHIKREHPERQPTGLPKTRTEIVKGEI